MTRLKENDVDGLGVRLAEYDRQLLHSIGVGLAGIGAHATGKPCGLFDPLLSRLRVGIIPIGYGQGIISGFSKAVQDIVEFLGVRSFITEHANIQGLAEAITHRADVLFLADDDHFYALHPTSGATADNSVATGRGFAAALDLMSGGVCGRNVLVIGAGPVGRSAVGYLLEKKGRVYLFDQDVQQVHAAQAIFPSIEVVDGIENGMVYCDLVIEATPAERVVPLQVVTDRTMIAAPGVPLGLEPAVQEMVQGRYVHDVLEIGVTTMLYAVLAKQIELEK